MIIQQNLFKITEFGKKYYYKIKLEGAANYVQVNCKTCNIKHFFGIRLK
jgi:hypothetical protein